MRRNSKSIKLQILKIHEINDNSFLLLISIILMGFSYYNQLDCYLKTRNINEDHQK